MDSNAQTPGISGPLTVWLPDLLYVNGRFERETALVCDAAGRIVAVEPIPEELFRVGGGRADSILLPGLGVVAAARFVRLRGRALLPGLVNAHSHAFQRVIRGRTEYRSSAAGDDSFWTWREMMYSVASRLGPEDIYDASRMAFLEMALAGITAVGEFHYLHRAPDGALYDDPNLLAKEVVRAARDAGLRVALLRVAYARAGYRAAPDPRQSRFIEPDVETYLRHLERLGRDLDGAHDERAAGATTTDDAAESRQRFAWVGVAPHSTRAVPLPFLRELSAYAAERRLPVHMHVAEQRAELDACIAEHGRTPVSLLAAEGILGARFTAVHAVHITGEEARALGSAGSCVCACPTTERNLGDGVVPADLLAREGVTVALGTDSHAQIDLLEDARELEYHLRLQRQQRNVLAPRSLTGVEARAESSGDFEADVSALAARLFACATEGGARSIGAPGGALLPGRPADFFTVALDDPSVAGADAADLLPAVLFSLARTAVRDVAVGGRLVVEDGRHDAAGEIVERFRALQRRLWG